MVGSPPPPPPSKFKLFDKKFKKKLFVSKNFFCCSQNLPEPILVLKKSIMKPLFTVFRIFLNVNFGVDPPPLLEKVYILIFFCNLPLVISAKC